VSQHLPICRESIIATQTKFSLLSCVGTENEVLMLKYLKKMSHVLF
jgi:hypothetical protein